MNDDEIDALYRVPPGEFTAARNLLAKSRGAAGAQIKALEKPSLPAWGVNQVYWKDRSAFDALVEAAHTMRQAHVQVISGRSADVAGAEAAHAAAVKTAVQSAKRLIDAVGEKATPATIDAITETLQALPTQDAPGRLTKPLKPMGFGALMSMGIPVVQGSAGPARRSPGDGGGPGVKGPSKHEIAEQAAARKAAEKALKAATAAEEKAEAAHADAKKDATHAERELARVRDRIQFLEKQRNDAEEVLRQRARALQEATNARIQAAQDVNKL